MYVLYIYIYTIFIKYVLECYNYILEIIRHKNLVLSYLVVLDDKILIIFMYILYFKENYNLTVRASLTKYVRAME